MRFQACLPPSWWEFSLDHAVHVYNRTPMRRLEWRTPHEWFTGERPSIECLQVLGCVRADLGGHLKYSQRWSGVRAGVLLGAQGAVRRGENRGGL